jgi:16S rRNA (guanine527-N7)-methyltransferase
MKNIPDLLKTALAENQISCDDSVQQKLVRYLELMIKWNKVFNLTSITHPREMVYLHIIDSLAVAPYLHGKRLLDVGSGAGLPGIPLAIQYPDQQWILLDKNNKKTRFLTQVIAELGLNNVTAMHSRCEDFQPELCFDSILSRAFGTIRMFVETTQHLLCKEGVFIAMKGKYPQTEVDELPTGFVVQKTERIDIKGIDVERHVICLSKK